MENFCFCEKAQQPQQLQQQQRSSSPSVVRGENPIHSSPRNSSAIIRFSSVSSPAAAIKFDRAEDLWSRLVAVTDNVETLPIDEMKGVISILPDTFRELASAVFPIITEASSVIPIFGPLPMLVFKFCLAVNQTLETREEYKNLIKDTVLVGNWLIRIHARVRRYENSYHIEFRERFKDLSLHLFKITEYMKKKRVSTGEPMNATVSNVMKKCLNFTCEVIFREINQANIEEMQSQLKKYRDDLNSEILFLVLTAIEKFHSVDGEDVSNDIKKLLPNLFDSFVWDIKQHLSVFKAGSREWLFQEVNAWLNGPEDIHYQNLFWLCADAGMGKSAFSAALWERLSVDDKILAVFFCRYGDSDRSDAYKVIQSLAYQICKYLPDCKDLINLGAKKIAKRVNENQNVYLRDYWRCLIQEPLNSCPEKEPRVILIDALDELDEKAGREEFLNLINLMVRDLPKWVRVIVTSRREEDIVQQLQELSDPRSIKEGDERHQRDLRDFITEELRVKVNSDDLTRAVEIFMAKSEGKFVYAANVVRHIIRGDKKFTLVDLENALPSGLNNIYKEYFTRINETITNYDISNDAFVSLLQLLTVAKQPLLVSLVRNLLKVNEADINRISDAIDPVFPKRGTNGIERFYTYHKSIIDWLLKDKRDKKSSLFNIDLKKSHEYMATQLISLKGTQEDGTWILPDNNDYLYTYLLDHLHEADKDKEIETYVFNLQWLQRMIQVRGANDFYLDMVRYSTYVKTNEMKLLVDTIKLALPTLQGNVERLPFQLFVRLRNVVRDTYILTNADPAAVIPVFTATADVKVHPDKEKRSSVKGHVMVYKCDDTTKHYYELCHGQGYISKVLNEGWSCTSNLCEHFNLKALIESRDKEIRENLKYYPVRYPLEGPGSLQLKVDLPDGVRSVAEWNQEYYICVCDDGNIYFIHQVTGEIDEEKTLQANNMSISSVALMSDGRIVCGADDRTVRVWDANTGKCVKTFGHNDGLWSVAVTSDGRIVSGSYDGTVRVWDADTGDCIRMLEGHSRGVRSVTVMSDGRIVSGSEDKTVRVWDATTGYCLKVLSGHSSGVRSVTVMSDGRIVSGSEDKTVRVWDATTGYCLKVLSGHSKGVRSVTVMSDGCIVSGSDDKTVRVWDATTGDCLKVLSGHSKNVNSVAAMSDGRIVSGSSDGTVRVWDASTGECMRVLEGHSSEVRSVAVMSGGRIVSGSDDNTVRVWDPSTGDCVQVLEGHRSSVSSVAVMSDGRIVSGSSDGTVRVWDASTGSVAVMANGRIVSGSNDKTVRVWDASTGGCVRVLKGHRSDVRSVAVMSDGRIVSGSKDKTVRVWNASTGYCLKVLNGHSESVSSVAVMSDGRIVSGSKDNTVRVWDVNTGKCVKTLGHSDEVWSVAVMSDGRIVSGSKDNTVRVWDPSTGDCLRVLEGHYTASFSQIVHKDVIDFIDFMGITCNNLSCDPSGQRLVIATGCEVYIFIRYI